MTAADREAILKKIETQPWARAQFDELVARSAERLAQQKADPDAYLRALPWDAAAAKGGHPILPQIKGNMASISGRPQIQVLMQAMLGHAVDCGVLYYLTEDSAYAALGADVLQALVQGLRGLETNEKSSNGGWLYPDDHLYEARILGAQLPILYDFVAGYVRQPGVTVWDLASKKRVPFDFAGAQEVFRTYARLAVERGSAINNWTVLEMPSLTHNALAMDDAKERARWLSHVTHVEAKSQASLKKIVSVFSRVGGVWPESFSYANDVASKVTYVVVLLNRQTTALELPKDISVLSRALMRVRDFRFPNGDLVSLGDGTRRSGLPLREFEMAYADAVRGKNTAGMSEFGGPLRAAIEDGSYDRSRLGPPPSGPIVYLSPLSLLWYAPEIEASAVATPPPPVTDELPFAGMVLQRNLSPDGKPEHGMMAAVHGSKFVHGHASGMALEIYGPGYVLGTNAGKGTYRSEEHENYRRIFASYNSVIVNGSSSSSGSWANLGIDTVRRVAGEPATGKPGVSANHSFTVTRFTDQQIAGTKAEQERTVGIVRTSNRGGYYVDIFRSHGEGAGQFHDYVFHHVGDRVEWRGAGGPLKITPAPERFKPVTKTKDVSYLYPGWHYFDQVGLASPAAGTLVADFSADRLGKAGVGARLYVPSATGREYAQAMAPTTFQAPEPYPKEPTPVVVIRQKGEAWDRPFAAIYEPYTGKESMAGIREVKALEVDGKWQGLVVSGEGEAGAFRHYLLMPAPEQPVVNVRDLQLRFEGRYAWISVDAKGEPQEIYLGQGSALRYRGVTLRSEDGKPFSAKAEKTAQGWKLTSSASGGRVVLSETPKM
ncbi:MAG: heparinase II/III family protein [Opitutaceae bacterium]|nr:heparinase II/III family protein [Opitutaceae bacterium]